MNTVHNRQTQRIKNKANFIKYSLSFQFERTCSLATAYNFNTKLFFAYCCEKQGKSWSYKFLKKIISPNHFCLKLKLFYLVGRGFVTVRLQNNLITFLWFSLKQNFNQTKIFRGHSHWLNKEQITNFCFYPCENDGIWPQDLTNSSWFRLSENNF